MKNVLPLLAAILIFSNAVFSVEETTKAETPPTGAAGAETEDEPKDTKPSIRIVCKSGSDTRVLQKRPSSDGGCEVTYKRGGSVKTVADAKNDLSYCDTTLEKIKANLISAGFTCE